MKVWNLDEFGVDRRLALELNLELEFDNRL